ncbi:autotransporter outer membrane beta-barrel domain-containing protein [Rhodobacteraceae bacterium B1Z28]|uniref:Autotransporter outer membrane beta-barrel domain-containing protein n=1 Tax=Ruegeria haliotis TaxID=2747601 RepID=A0ABX2PYF9_9RHOB|nr:autotransporter outer membrane beta-barrel domain-containing protein [Ruegeria haliotis]NVO58582.1 autotransporter outer membrane beta-barrel domain-containing protein [Ruegeria haliotis]
MSPCFNGSAGYSGQLENGLALALGLGVFRSDGDTNSTDFDTDGFYLDASVGRQIGAYTLEAGLGYGWLSTEKSRQINGSADANADYDSTLLTAYVGFERAFDVADGFGLLGFGDVRYTRQKDNGYTETGSSANVTVGDSTTDVIEVRLGAEAEKSLGSGGLVIGQLSGVMRRNLGDTDAAVTVFSSQQTLSFASTDFTGASVLVGYEHELVTGMKFEAIAEQEIGSNAQGPNFQAGLQWSF